MHELGHNLDLHHGGSDDLNYKPNYLSVMNYNFQLRGIPFGASPGDTVVAGRRLDYSDRLYPVLNEIHLDERVGLGGPPNDTDISLYFCDFCATGPPSRLVPTTGPVDWNQDGVIEPDVTQDLRPDFLPNLTQIYPGFDDWGHVQQFLNTPDYVRGVVRPQSKQP